MTSISLFARLIEEACLTAELHIDTTADGKLGAYNSKGKLVAVLEYKGNNTYGIKELG